MTFLLTSVSIDSSGKVQARVIRQGRKTVPDFFGISAIHGGQITNVAPREGFIAPSRQLAADITSNPARRSTPSLDLRVMNDVVKAHRMIARVAIAMLTVGGKTACLTSTERVPRSIEPQIQHALEYHDMLDHAPFMG